VHETAVELVAVGTDASPMVETVGVEAARAPRPARGRHRSRPPERAPP
jgi:hypothetical protein